MLNLDSQINQLKKSIQYHSPLRQLQSHLSEILSVQEEGPKLEQKIYYRHSDYVGGMKEMTLKEKLDKKPESVIELAVKGMLPKGPLGRAMIKKLFVYAGPEHPHAAQKPEELTF